MWPPRVSTLTLFYPNLDPIAFQWDLKKKYRMRAILQAIALPSKSVKRNIEEAEKQFQSKPSYSIPSLPSLYIAPSLHLLFSDNGVIVMS